MSSDFAFEVVDDEGVHVVTLFGQLDLSNAPRVRELLHGMDGRGTIVDLSGLTFCDSSGVAALLGARSDAESGGRSLALRGATGIVRQVFEVTGLTTLLEEEPQDPGSV